MTIEGMGAKRVPDAASVECPVFGGNLELCATHFTNAVARLCRDMELDSGVARTVRDHLQYYNATVATDISKSLEEKKPGKSAKALAEARAHIHKLIHWLSMFENLDEKVAKSARYCRITGESLLTILDADAKEGPVRGSTSGLNRGLSNL